MRPNFLLFSATAVVAQLSAVPQCAQAYFAQAAHIAGCVNSKSSLDLACACTSSSILEYPSSSSYRDTAVNYVRRGKGNTSCTSEEWTLLLAAMRNMCYYDDGSPKFSCGIPSGSPIPHTPTTRIAPTGTRTTTVTGEKYTSTRTLSLYPYSTFSYRITTLYTTNTFTSIEPGTTSIITTRSIRYVASCYTAYAITLPTTISRVTVTASSTRLTITAVPTTRITVTASAKTVTKTATDYSNDLWDKISSAEVSQVTINSSTGQALPTVTGTSSNSSLTSGATNGASGVPTSTAAVAPSATTASSSAGKVGVMSLGLVGVLGIMFVFA